MHSSCNKNNGLEKDINYLNNVINLGAYFMRLFCLLSNHNLINILLNTIHIL
jgi:hypothetical protein